MKIIIDGYEVNDKPLYFVVKVLVNGTEFYNEKYYNNIFEAASVGYCLARTFFDESGAVLSFSDELDTVSFSPRFIEKFGRELSSIDPNWKTFFQHYEKSAAAATANSNRRNKSLQ